MSAEPEGSSLACCVCGAHQPAAESARVNSNIRQFAGEAFVVSRCRKCHSLHSLDDVDLAHYYAHYPFHGNAELDPVFAIMYRALLGRLTDAGLLPEHRILDYGCGNGAFVRFATSKGYQAVGFDAYSEQFSDRSVLDATYDVVLSQDVIEHVDEPVELLAEYERLCLPEGLIIIGTPNASAISLSDWKRHVHALHQPYHRHILSKEALQAAAQARGWELIRYYPTIYNNTRTPFINSRFALHYFRAFDNTLDVAFEGGRFSWKLLNPMSAFWGVFGSFFAEETDVMFAFRRP